MHLLNVQQGLRGWNDVGLCTGWWVMTCLNSFSHNETLLLLWTHTDLIWNSVLSGGQADQNDTHRWMIPFSVPLIVLFLLSYNYYRNIPQTCAGCHYLQSYRRNAQKQHPMQNTLQTSLFFPENYLNSSVIFLISKIAQNVFSEIKFNWM